MRKTMEIHGQLYFTISNNEFKYVNSDIKNYKELLRATLWKIFSDAIKKDNNEYIFIGGRGNWWLNSIKITILQSS